MVPIALDDHGQKFDQEGLKQFIIETCNEHHAQQRALAFAFLVYDFQSAAMRKVLKDKEYWTALHDLSGQYLSVFYIDSKNKQNADLKRKAFENALSNPKGFQKFLTPITLEKTPLDEFVHQITLLFNIKESFSPPFILFFQIENSDIIDSHFIALEEERIDGSFLEIKDHLKNAVDAIKKIKPENYTNKKPIFNCIKREVESGKFYKKVKAGKLTGKIADALQILRFPFLT